MLKSELIRAIATQSDTSIKNTQAVIDAMVEVIQHTLAQGEEVNVAGFMSMKIVPTEERQGHNPSTGEPMTIPAGHRLRVTPAKRLKDIVKYL